MCWIAPAHYYFGFFLVCLFVCLIVYLFLNYLYCSVTDFFQCTTFKLILKTFIIVKFEIHSILYFPTYDKVVILFKGGLTPWSPRKLLWFVDPLEWDDQSFPSPLNSYWAIYSWQGRDWKSQSWKQLSWMDRNLYD